MINTVLFYIISFGFPILIIKLFFLFNKKEKKTKNEYEIYFEKYNNKFDTKEIVEISDEKKKLLKNSILFENTPIGNVIMYYNNENTEFDYYSNRNMSYNFLETICKKYVTMFNCKELYREYEIEKKKHEENEKKKKEEKKEIVKKKSVYANFKKYNNETLKFDENEPFLQNRYHYKGNLKDFNMLKPIKIEKKKFTIQDFLLQIKNNKN